MVSGDSAVINTSAITVEPLVVYYYALFYRAPGTELPLDCYWELAGTAKMMAVETGYFAQKMFYAWLDALYRIQDGQGNTNNTGQPS